MASLNDFLYVGSVPASKSLLNRALIVQSYFPYLKLIGDSRCDDVIAMRRALASFGRNEPMDCGHGGTVLRFMALRASRQKGRHVLRGSPRLMSRLPDSLCRLLMQLGCEARITGEQLIIEGDGWHPMGDCIHVPVESSSQFASALILNCWQLPRDIHFSLGKGLVSAGYWQMTLRFLRQLGLSWEQRASDYFVRAGQSVVSEEMGIEPDMSSAFALAAVAAVAGQARFIDFPKESLQPDFVFVEILKAMGVRVVREGSTLEIHRASSLKSAQWDLRDMPDLFPVLAALCALARGESRLRGAQHLKHKESDRLGKMVELLSSIGCLVSVLDDGVLVHGPTELTKGEVQFDCDEDHRLVMAAALLEKAGFPIRVAGAEAVTKSFPEFLEIVRPWP